MGIIFGKEKVKPSNDDELSYIETDLGAPYYGSKKSPKSPEKKDGKKKRSKKRKTNLKR